MLLYEVLLLVVVAIGLWHPVLGRSSTPWIFVMEVVAGICDAS
jgi:hypothetical protein